MKNKFVFLLLFFLITVLPIFGVAGDSMIGTECFQVERIGASGELMEQQAHFVALFQECPELISSQATAVASISQIRASYNGPQKLESPYLYLLGYTNPVYRWGNNMQKQPCTSLVYSC